MRLLKLSISGLPLFSGELELEFVATQRVSAENAENMHNVFAKIYQNNVLSFVGINASGKTSLLKALIFTMGMLRGNLPINSLPCREVLEGLAVDQEVVIKSYFYSKLEKIHCLRTVIRKNMYDFDNVQPDIVRDQSEQYLLDDMSIVVAFNKRSNDPIEFVDMLQHTDTNHLAILSDVPMEMISFFDPSIEYLRIQHKKKGPDIRLKFYDKDEIVVTSIAELNQYLSSGTIKGINTFVYAMRTFETGGYLVVDELENHFNKEIVSTLIRFYRDKRVNPKGAVLIFTTHYAELLDEFERNDNIYIVRNRNGITAQNLADVLKRNDIKKSEAYESGFLEGTVPVYESYMALKKMLLAQRVED